MLFKSLALLALLLPIAPKEPMMHHISGTFDVTMKPQTTDGNSADIGLARMSIDKVFHGGIVGTSKGEMLASGDYSTGSAGYVAFEKITGTVEGASGQFVLQHSATMDHGAPSMSVTVVPGSGTDALKGLSGKLEIQIAQGKHSYTFDYMLKP